ncbi:MAG TPA: RNA polymerase factor sigma-54 [Xanthomonadales bacterium]|nr:RNA polymerase factor sigma-54 [Xanthomonadales bacterium]
MKPSLQTRLGQQLTLTPQLRQAIRLLQLSGMELEAELALAVETNPLLEHAEELERVGSEPGDPLANAEDDRSDSDPTDRQGDADLTEDFAWERTGSGGSGDSDYNAAESISSPETLHDYLLWQLHLSHLSERDRRIGSLIIEAISEDGYLGATIEEIRESLLPETSAEPAEILTVLSTVQRFDPLGVGARSPSECLSVQLSALDPTTPGLALAITLAGEHLEALARLGPDRLARELTVTLDEMNEAVSLLRSLDPRPGLRFDAAEPEFIRPDCVAWRDQGVWRVRMAAGSQPRLGINDHYRSLIARLDQDNAAYLRGQLQEAKWLLRSLETRADTLLRVARAIVRHQSAFLEHGPEAMRPLTLREVAEELGLHESTVSRASTRKYLRTPRGTFEFRHFFSSGVATGEGGANSATAIQAMIRRLIEAEDPRRPLSDARLTEQLKRDGVPVARRTVAKYREAMNIPASNERQRLG